MLTDIRSNDYDQLSRTILIQTISDVKNTLPDYSLNCVFLTLYFPLSTFPARRQCRQHCWGELQRLLPNPNALVALGKGSKTLHQQNPPDLNWRYRLTQVDLYNGRWRWWWYQPFWRFAHIASQFPDFHLESRHKNSSFLPSPSHPSSLSPVLPLSHHTTSTATTTKRLHAASQSPSSPIPQSCPWVHFVWPDPTQSISWLTQHNPP